MTAPKLWWSPTAAAMSGKHGIVDRDAVYWRVDWNGPALDELPADAVRLVPVPRLEALLRRCAEIERRTVEVTGGGIEPVLTTAEIRALLAAPVPGNTTEENRDGA